MQQVALLQAAVALSASLGRVMSSTKGQLRHKLWDDWGTNRTVTVWQTMEVLSDKLTSRCVTSYLCALVTSKTNSYATSRSLTSCSCLVSKSWTRSVMNQRALLRHKLWDVWGTNRTVTVWQTMEVLSDKLTSHCGTSYLSALVTSKTNSYATSRFNYKLQLPCQQVLDALCHQPKGNCVTSYGMTEAQTEQSLCDKLSVLIGDKQNKLLCNKSL